MCGKPKISSDSIFKNQTVQKSDIRSDGFPTETAFDLQFRLKVTKSKFTNCADKECFETLP